MFFQIERTLTPLPNNGCYRFVFPVNYGSVRYPSAPRGNTYECKFVLTVALFYYHEKDIFRTRPYDTPNQISGYTEADPPYYFINQNDFKFKVDNCFDNLVLSNLDPVKDPSAADDKSDQQNPKRNDRRKVKETPYIRLKEAKLFRFVLKARFKISELQKMDKNTVFFDFFLHFNNS